MNHFRKSAVLAVAFVFAFSVSTFSAKRSEAAVGMVVPGLVVVGASLAAPFVGLGVGCVIENDSNGCGMAASVAGFAIGTALGIVGLIVGITLLPSETPDQSIAYVPLTEHAIAQLRAGGLTDEMVESYHENLPELNLVAQSVGRDLIDSNELTIENAARLWKKYGQGVDAKAVQVAALIGAYHFKKAEALQQ